MTTLIFRAKMQPGKEDAAVAALKEMCESVDAEEPKALAYLFHRSQDDPSEAVLFESYEDDAALQSHMQTPHMSELRAAFGELFDMSQVGAERLDRVAGFSRGASEGEGTVTVIFYATALKGKEDEAVAALGKMVEGTQANEPNTLVYALHRLQSDPARVAVFECYASDADFQAHTQTPHMAEMRAAFPELFDPSTVRLERLDHIGGFARVAV